MMHLDAYHLSSTVTQADRDERYQQDRTCNACGFDDIKASGHECSGYPEPTA